MPEVQAVARLTRDGQPELTVRRFLTFVSAMDRMRDSNRLWADAVELLASQPETFDPATVSVMPLVAWRDAVRRSYEPVPPIGHRCVADDCP